MKISVLLLLLFSLHAQSQLIKPIVKKWNTKETLNRINDTTVYFVDYEKKGGKKEIATINPNEIALITAYFEEEEGLPIIFKNYLEHGAISLITKRYAISIYKPELSRFSKDYSELAKLHCNDYDSLFYVIDGEVLTPNVEGKLMNIDFSKIKSIKVSGPEEAEKKYGDKAKRGAVIINSFSK